MPCQMCWSECECMQDFVLKLNFNSITRREDDDPKPFKILCDLLDTFYYDNIDNHRITCT